MSEQITDFDSLLKVAAQQPDPQRLLFVFLQVALPPEASAEEKARFEEGNGGQLMPVICVDKALDELSSFAALVEESDREMGEAWQIVLVAAMSGENGQMPTSAPRDDHQKH